MGGGGGGGSRWIAMERVCTKYALNRRILKRVLRLVFARHQFPRHKITDLRQDLTTAVDAQVARDEDITNLGLSKL